MKTGKETKKHGNLPIFSVRRSFRQKILIGIAIPCGLACLFYSMFAAFSSPFYDLQTMALEAWGVIGLGILAILILCND